MYDVIALGELLIDFASLGTDQEGYPTMKANPGGAPANFLAALSKYGKKTAFLGKVGDDAFGHLMIGTLKSAGIDTQGVVVDDQFFTTLAFVTLDDQGDRSFSFARKPGADTQLEFSQVDCKLIEKSQVFHFGTLSLTHQPAASCTRLAVAYAKSQGKLITFDPNLRLNLWDSPETAKKQILWGLSQALMVKISDEEVEFLWNCTPEEGAQRILQDYGVELVVLTLGSKGSVLLTQKARGQAHCPAVQPIDTTGAGDICGGAALSCLLDLGKPFGEVSSEELTQIARFASTAASLSTEKSGGILSIPDRETVEARL